LTRHLDPLRVLRCASLALGLVVGAAHADVSAVGAQAFVGAAVLVDFEGVLESTEVNGARVGDLQFAYSLGDGFVSIGPRGDSDHLQGSMINSVADTHGLLTILLPGPATALGYGWRIFMGPTAVPDATTITLYDGAVAVGSLSYAGAPAPNLPGGCAGIASTLPFDRATVRFNAGVTFSLDNVSASLVPEPATALLQAAGLALLGWRWRRWQQRGLRG
jgi:hypothetical protein